jgi:hypothetical protein
MTEDLQFSTSTAKETKLALSRSTKEALDVRPGMVCDLLAQGISSRSSTYRASQTTQVVVVAVVVAVGTK